MIKLFVALTSCRRPKDHDRPVRSTHEDQQRQSFYQLCWWNCCVWHLSVGSCYC